MTDINSMLDLGLADTTTHPLSLAIKKADGVYLHTKDRGLIFDAISGIGVSNFGHGNKTITDLIHKQVDKNLHTMVYGEFIHESTVEAGKLLIDILPSSLNSVYFVNSGAEAVEGALKLAKRITKRSKIIAVSGGYHGNTSGALSVSSNAKRKAPFLPLLPEISFIEHNRIDDIFAIDSSIACVIIETIQGDAGVKIPSLEYMQCLRDRCSAHGVQLIFDEVQCGMGRTGKAFAFEHFNVVPDILCLGKALGGGMSIGAFVSSKAQMSHLSHSPELGHITTFGGHPVACAGAVGALQCLKELDLEKTDLLGKTWEDALVKHPSVKSVRRIGLYFYVELDSPEHVQKAVLNGLDNGVLLFWFLSVPNAFRLSPPLTMTPKEAKVGIDLILKSLPTV